MITESNFMVINCSPIGVHICSARGVQVRVRVCIYDVTYVDARLRYDSFVTTVVEARSFARLCARMFLMARNLMLVSFMLVARLLAGTCMFVFVFAVSDVDVCSLPHVSYRVCYDNFVTTVVDARFLARSCSTISVRARSLAIMW